MLRLLWIQRPDDRRESFEHNPADAHDARPAGSLNPSNHSVAVLRLLWIQIRRESFKQNPADAHDARPAGSRNPSNHSVAALHLLWIQRPDDRRESFKQNPADAHDARPAGSLNPSNHSVRVLRLLWVQRPDDRGDRVLNIIQLMLMMLGLALLCGFRLESQGFAGFRYWDTISMHVTIPPTPPRPPAKKDRALRDLVRKQKPVDQTND